MTLLIAVRAINIKLCIAELLFIVVKRVRFAEVESVPAKRLRSSSPTSAASMRCCAM